MSLLFLRYVQKGIKNSRETTYSHEQAAVHLSAEVEFTKLRLGALIEKEGTKARKARRNITGESSRTDFKRGETDTEFCARCSNHQ